MRTGTGKGGKGRETGQRGKPPRRIMVKHRRQAWGCKKRADKHSLEGENWREMAQLCMVLLVLQPQCRWDVTKTAGPCALGSSACHPASESDQPQPSDPNINTKFQDQGYK